MLLIKELTSEPKQRHTILLPTGEQVVLTLEYKPMQLGWFIQQIAFNDWEANNLRVVTSPNMLHQFKNQIPFGLACFVSDGHEPSLLEDFSAARAQLFVLTSDEATLYEEFLSGQAPT